MSEIYCVSSSVSLPYDITMSCFDKELTLQTGDMQRTPTSLIPLYLGDPPLEVYLKAVCPDKRIIDSYLIDKYLCQPHAKATIAPTEALGFTRDALMQHVTAHKLNSNIMIVSSKSNWIGLLYKCAAYLVQTKKHSATVLVDRTPTFWYINKQVFDDSCIMIEELREKNKLLNAGDITFTLARADGTRWYEQVR